MKYWHAGSLGADGEDYRADYVHAAFPEKSALSTTTAHEGPGSGACQPTRMPNPRGIS
jgi:hypothetical protein